MPRSDLAELIPFEMTSFNMDSSVTKIGSSYLVQSTDFFYPIVDDPFTQGQITACNVLSDIYATGVTRIDNVLMLLGIPKTIDRESRSQAAKELIRGFNSICEIAEVNVSGGQTVFNPLFLIGGVASSLVSNDELICPNLRPGDVLVLTKRLGIQAVVNQFIQEKKSGRINESTHALMNSAIKSMVRLNKFAAKLMHKYGARGSTDVTGFGILGHADNLAKVSKVAIEITHLPLFSDEVVDDRLLKGNAPETSGGLLIALSEENVAGFLNDILVEDEAFVVGKVLEGKGAFLSDQIKLI